MKNAYDAGEKILRTLCIFTNLPLDILFKPAFTVHFIIDLPSKQRKAFQVLVHEYNLF